MKTRVISGIFLLLIMGSALYMGGLYLYLLCLFISVVGMYELYKVYKIEKTPIGILGYIMVCVYYAALYVNVDNAALFIITMGVILMMAVYVITFPKYNANQVMCCMFGFLYVGVMLSYIYMTRRLSDGIYIVWLIFVSSWVNDTFAYFTGVMLGKHKMAPKLSPKKSIEGAVGGVAGSVIIGAVYGYIVAGHVTEMVIHPAYVFAVASGAGALLSIIGDLAASAIKRNYDIKDYGKLIPGHGGILDRFDSVIFTAPIVYWAVYMINNII